MFKKREPLSPEQKRRRFRRRVLIYTVLGFGLYGAYRFQPIEIEFFPRKAPPYVKVDPDSARLFSKGARVLVITAHPDDSEFYAGGILTRLKETGAELGHLLHTDGDKSYYFWTDTKPLRKIRREEQTKASKMWGAEQIWFMGLPDGRIRFNKESVAGTVEKIREFKPDYILSFDPIYHPTRNHQDHSRSGEIVWEAAKQAGFDGWMLLYSTRGPNFVVDVDRVWNKKLELLAVHASQFYGGKLKWIQDFRADAAVKDGELAGFSFGEGFRAVKL